MQKLAVLAATMAVLLSGCVLAPEPRHDRPPPHRGYGDRHYDRDRDRDRDRDGVPNRYDRRPDDPRRN